MPESSSTDQITGLLRDLSISVARMDERIKSVQNEVLVNRDELKETKEELRKEIKEITAEFVKKIEFEPIKRFVYGFIVFVLGSIGTLFFALLK